MNIESAIKNKQLLTFNYRGYSRTVEPHAFGTDTKGHLALRAYQVKGGSASGEPTGWKIFHVNEIKNLTALSEHFPHARPDYKRNDPAFSSIRAQL